MDSVPTTLVNTCFIRQEFSFTIKRSWFKGENFVVNSTFKSFPEKDIDRVAFPSVLSAISAFLEHYSKFYADPIVPRTLFGTETSNSDYG